VLQINLKALFFLSQAAARVMDGQGAGKIINIVSMLSFQGGILVPSYTAAKSGVAGLTCALANEWAAKGINVNASRRATWLPTTLLPCAPTRNGARLSWPVSQLGGGDSRRS